ncbi:DUF3429 domain-containing protein [Alishewanella sp. HL-SH05]|uniref:DUF3429 domain-containing protein n=1 Tax=Alishewanella sp. HL-SH05 TaxID=3461145 RepID=UPI0040410977
MIHLLGYAGLIPFLLLPVASLVWPLVAPAQAMLLFQFYSCLILGFMAGVLWPVLHQPKAATQQALAAVSFPVVSFLALALLPAYSVLIQAGLFLTLSFYEHFSGISQHYQRSYRQLRYQLTAVVVSCHLGYFYFYG